MEKERKTFQPGELILGEDRYYSMDDFATKVNNNVLVVGTSGAGKTRSVVTPNLLQATGSYVVSDPKGNLYKQYGRYLESKGYKVRKLDLKDLKHSTHYNFMRYIRSEQDIVKVSHILVYELSNGRERTLDPFWDESTCLLLQALMAYVIMYTPEEQHVFSNVLQMLTAISVDEGRSSGKNAIDEIFERLETDDPDSFALKQYKKFRLAASRTLRSILIALAAKTVIFDMPELKKIMADDEIKIREIGLEKTAVFVCVSDTDRSLDCIANLFFSQAMNVLCDIADEYGYQNRLPVPVRFILDDFATNVHIDEFPRMISSIRSRGISAMLMIQAEAQLEDYYKSNAGTVISNCDTYVYMGTNDLATAKNIATRLDVPLKKVLYMPVGTSYIFRRGSEPQQSRNFDLDLHMKELLGTNKCLEETPTTSYNKDCDCEMESTEEK